MCVIAMKQKGCDWPDIRLIQQCCKANPDGFAIAWNEDGELKVFKTLDSAEFLARYYTLSTTLDPATTGAMIHARIKTHGSVKLENCHCFLGGGFAFSHNGILRNIPARDDMTDSETFFRDYFLPVYEALGWETAERVSRAIAAPSSSRLAWLDTNGDMHLIGEWYKNQEQGKKGKIYFSNTSYRIPTMSYCYNSSSFGRLEEPTPKKKQNIPGKPIGNYGEKHVRRSAGSDDVDAAGPGQSSFRRRPVREPDSAGDMPISLFDEIFGIRQPLK